MPYISDIDIGSLLIFYSIGITLVALVIQVKMTIYSRPRHISKDKKLRASGMYRFIKMVFNWGTGYFISAVVLLLASVVPKTSLVFRPLLYNISVIIVLVTTILITYYYFSFLIIPLIHTNITAARYNLADRHFSRRFTSFHL